jgi:DNA-binding NarL/FixJ family response regulator
MRVLLADDHALFREGLADRLAVSGIDVVGLASNGLEAVQKTRELRPDAVVMDLQMPRCDGLTATRMIRAEFPETKVIILTMTETDPLLAEALNSGASGYFLKDLDCEDLLDALRRLDAGSVLASREDAFVPAGEGEQDSGDAIPGSAEFLRIHEELTDRQIQVLALAAEGKTYKEIGHALALTESAIKYHMGQIAARLGLKDGREAIKLAIRANLGVRPRTL